MEVSQLKKNKLINYTLTLSALLILLSIILFEEASFVFLGIGISIMGFIILYIVNH